MPLIADGAMGTELLERTGFQGSPAALNFEDPNAVLALHRDYAQAGAQLLVTNTLGATPEQAEAGVRLAREALAECHSEGAERPKNLARRQSTAQAGKILRFAQSDILLAGSVAVSPPPSPALIQSLAGADILIIETATSLGAAEAALEAIRRTSDQPIWCTLSFAADGSVQGLRPAQAARTMQALDVPAFGYGCGFGLEAARRVLAELRQAAPEAKLIAKPSLGLPRGGRYEATPQQTAAWAAGMAGLGIDVIGLCCGSTPAHIRAVADRLRTDW